MESAALLRASSSFRASPLLRISPLAAAPSHNPFPVLEKSGEHQQDLETTISWGRAPGAYGSYPLCVIGLAGQAVTCLLACQGWREQKMRNGRMEMSTCMQEYYYILLRSSGSSGSGKYFTGHLCRRARIRLLSMSRRVNELGQGWSVTPTTVLVCPFRPEVRALTDSAVHILHSRPSTILIKCYA